jgi:KDO2-lipid IV(A) lauroyltransferase
MKIFGYYISLFFIYLVILVPFPLFYGISDVAYFLLYHVFGYRRKVVMENLRNSFPEKNEKELEKISRRYFRYLCDFFLETPKTLIITRSCAIRHCKLAPEAKALFDRYNNEKKSVILVMGHFGNWEWAGNTFSLLGKQPLYVIYHPLSNSHFNGLMRKMRMRFGTRLIAMKDAYKDMVKLKDEVNVTAFIADQTPSPENAYWTRFLNQDTPVFKGPEKIARKLNYPVVYVRMERIKRGYYVISAETLFEEPNKTTEGEISEAHTRKLETDILKQPEIWLWSHRRWKHKRPESTTVQ